MITVEVMGGLGNQLFQIFMLIAYCFKYDRPFYFEDVESNNIKRPRYWNTFLKGLKTYIKPGKINIPLLREDAFHYKEIQYVTNETFKFFGYFQSYKYFIEYEKDIYDLIQLEEQKNKIKINCENKVSMHFRIGDYKTLQAYHPILPKLYYEKAIKKLMDDTMNDKWTILYFYEKEDEDTVMKIIHYLKHIYPTIVFESIDSKYKDYEQLLIMSKCKHNIIANSSFSWWGAYLNKNPNKNVYYPNIWFGEKLKHNTKDMFPSNWHKIYLIGI